MELLLKLLNVNFDRCSDNPQSIWNHFEQSLVPIVDELAPIVDLKKIQTQKSCYPLH